MIKKVSSPIILLVLIPILLTIIWFRHGNIMGTAEAGLPFYDFQIQYNVNKDAWANYALGYPANISVASIPTNILFAFLQNFGIPGFLMQAFFLCITLIISGISIYFLTKNFFSNVSNKFLILAPLFYWFNPFSMVNVWNRFLNNFFIFYMLLPASLLFFLKGLQSRRYIYALFIGLISAVFSYALTSIAFNLLLWLVFFYTSIFYIFTSTDKRKRFFIINFFCLSLFYFCLINLWWISQIFSYVYTGSFSVVEQTSFSSDKNIDIFTSLSKRLGNLIYLLRFEHATFFGPDSEIEWVILYKFPPVVFFCFVISLLIFLPLFLGRKNSSVLYLGGLAILSIFMAKGSNPPFGELFNFTFIKFSFLQALRNAFEKFGFLLQLACSSLFAFGVYTIHEKINKKLKKFLYLIVLLWLVVIFGFPYWTGLIFTGSEIPINIPSIGYQVKVPDYYKSASDWLDRQVGDFRFVALPLGGEGITYNWEKGYAGVELSNQLFPVKSISFQTNTPFYYDISGDLEKAFLNKGDFTKIMNILNAKYIMLRGDISWNIRRMRDPVRIFQILKEKEREGEVKMAGNFGALSFWENPDWADRKIYASNLSVLVSPQVKISDAGFLTEDSILIGDNISLKDTGVSKIVVHPLARISLEEFSQTPFFEKSQDIFPHVRFSPNSKVYSAILLKEKIELSATADLLDRVDYAVKLLGKRLVEAKSESESNNAKGVMKALENYENLLNYSFSNIFGDYRLIDSDNQLIKQEDLYHIFSRHKAVLDEIKNIFLDNNIVVDKLIHTEKLIDTKLIGGRIKPQFGFMETDEFPLKNRIVHKFNIIYPGEYELLWGNDSLDKYYKKNSDSATLLQVDDQLELRNFTLNKSGLRSYGKILLTEGVHEFGINTPDEINLVDTPDEFNLKVGHGVEKESFPIKNYDPYATYKISFDYWTKTGSGLEISVEANNSKINSGKVEPEFLEGLGPDNYDFREKHFSSVFKVNGSADSAKLIFKVKPWNDCESIFFTRGKHKCKEESFRRPYDRTTDVVVRNVTFTRRLIDEPILVKSNSLSSPVTAHVTYEKIDPTNYRLTVRDAKEPFILVLSELFDPGWKIFTSDGSELKGKHFLVNGYANGWQIERGDNQKLTLKFAPQDLLTSTGRISQAAFILGLLIVVWNFRRRNVKNI